MTDAERKTGFDLGYFFTGEGLKDWFKAWGSGWRLAATVVIAIVLVVGIMRIADVFFPKPKQNISQPRIVALPGSKVGDVDMRTIQVAVGEKPWEVMVGGAAFSYDNKNGGLFGVAIKKKF